MFESLQDRLEGIIHKVKGYGKITEENISEMVREVRLALLEADVNYKVVKEFTNNVKEKALGEEVNKSLKPGEVFVKIVSDELVNLLGGEKEELNLLGNPAVLMLVGLQGSGKTTTIGKLSLLLRKKHAKKPFTEEEQRAKFLEYAETKDQKVFNDIFEHNYRFILYIASKYSFIYRIPLDEAVSVACEGAMQAIKSYDVNRGVEFHNYAQKAMRSKLIYQQLDRYKRGKDTFLVDILKAKLKREKEYGMKIDDSLLGREILEEVLDSLVEIGDCVEEKKGKRRTKEDIRNLINIADHLNVDEVLYDEEEYSLEEDSYNNDLKKEMEKAFNAINTTEKKVLKYRYGLEDDQFKTLQDCADYFNVSKQRIHQVEKTAFQKIKRSKYSKELKEFL